MVAIVKQKSALGQLTGWNEPQIELIKTQIAPGCSDDELKLFGTICQQTGLNPFLKQIYAQKRKDKTAPGGEKLVIITGIDGFRLIAERTGRYAGQDKPKFDEGLNLYEHLNSGRDRPLTAEVTVYKIVNGVRCPFTGEASWGEFCQTKFDGSPTSMWVKMPHSQLAKCAEAQALRKAFPNELSGLAVGEAPEPVYSTDYRESKAWTDFQGWVQRAIASGDTANVNKAEQWGYRRIEEGVLPAQAKNGIQMEVERAYDVMRERGYAPMEIPETPAPIPVTASDISDEEIKAVEAEIMEKYIP